MTNTLVITLDLFHYHCYDNSCEALPVTTVGFLSCWLLMTNTLVITLDLFHYHCYDNSCEALPVTSWLLVLLVVDDKHPSNNAGFISLPLL